MSANKITELQIEVARLTGTLAAVLAWAESQADAYAELDHYEPEWTPEIGGVHELSEILADVGLHLDCPCEECVEVSNG